MTPGNDGSWLFGCCLLSFHLHRKPVQSTNVHREKYIHNPRLLKWNVENQVFGRLGKKNILSLFSHQCDPLVSFHCFSPSLLFTASPSPHLWFLRRTRRKTRKRRICHFTYCSTDDALITLYHRMASSLPPLPHLCLPHLSPLSPSLPLSLCFSISSLSFSPPLSSLSLSLCPLSLPLCTLSLPIYPLCLSLFLFLLLYLFLPLSVSLTPLSPWLAV